MAVAGVLILLPVTVLLTACAFKSTSNLSELDSRPILPDNFLAQQGAYGVDTWWQSWADIALQDWLKRALQNNNSLQAARQRYAQTKASAAALGSEQFPSVNAELGRARDINGGEPSSASNRWNAGLTASYELDIWGRINALDEQGQLSMLSQQAKVRLQRTSVISQVSLSWYNWQAERAHLILLQQQQKRLQEALQVIEGRFRRGLVTVADVWQQQQLIEANLAEQASAQALQDNHWQVLRLWMGGNVRDLPAELTPLPTLPSLPTQIQLQALQQRPDVQAAWYQLRSDDAALAAAVANRYPRLSLSASVTSTSTGFADLFDNWLANLAANLVLPLIDGGQRRAEVERQQAVVKEQIANYRQAWLQAAHDVQQALINARQAGLQVDSVSRQLSLARKNEAFQASRYRKGVADFLNLLNAQQDVLQLENQLLQWQQQQLQSHINFYTSLSPGADVLSVNQS